MNYAKGYKYYQPKFTKRRALTKAAVPGSYDDTYNVYQETQAEIVLKKKIEQTIEMEIDAEFHAQKLMK